VVKALLLDVEGTVAPLTFVKEVLFPYSEKKLLSFLKERWEDPQVKKLIKEAEELSGRKLSSPEEAEELFREWIKKDLKVAPLKEIQGHVWEEGFKRGELKAPLYRDACKKIKEWHGKGYRLFVYSSGSVKAQKLFFSHTECGDLTPYFEGFFDTRTGLKKEKTSYEKIAQKIGLPPSEVLFVSDNPEELRAAKEAGMKVVQSVREGVEPSPEFPQIRSFEEIEP